MEKVRRRLMLKESESRLNSAALLHASGDDSDSAYLLRLLGFELLLKVVVEQSTSSTAYGHKYAELFALLPESLQDQVLRLADERIGPSVLSTNHVSVLEDLGNNFVCLRYPYERYGNMTQQAYKLVGQSWVDAGEKNEDAEHRYHPEELLGLICALEHIANVEIYP